MLETRSARLLDGDVATALVEAASAAPSVHNSQPWIFTVGERTVDLHADPARHLAVSDGSGRSLLISCGAALFNLRVAADHLGFHPRVRILPTKDDPTHVARLEVDHRHGSPGFLEDLFPAVWSRRTNRFPFWNRRIPRSVLSRLQDAVSLENSLLRIVDQPAEVERIVALLHDAERADLPEAKLERAAWLGRDGAPDGIPSHALGPRPHGPLHPLPRPPGRRPGARRSCPAAATEGEPRTAPFETTPTVAILSTLKDSPGRLGAGRSGAGARPAGRHRRGAVRVVHEPAAGAARPALAGALAAHRCRRHPDDHADRLRRPGAGDPRRPVAEVIRLTV